MKKIPGLRWWIVAMIFFASVLNYVDRQALSILAPTIQAELAITDEGYATVLNIFMVAYTLSYLLSGRLVDRWGVRIGLAVFVGWWSVANMLTGLAQSLGSLGVCRFLLGMGEAGNWTAAPKAVSEWFPAKERGIAIGIYTLGSAIGATLAPVVILSLASFHSWQLTFAVTGAAGLLWIIPWVWLYRRPEEHPRITAKELALIRAGAAGEAQGTVEPVETISEGARWKAIFSHPAVWMLLVGRLLTDPVWYFYQFWFAKYLHQARELDQAALAITWVIFLAADVGVLTGGWLSGRLIQRKITPQASRLWVMLGCAVLMPFSALVPLAGPLWVAMAFGMVVVLAHMAWMINLSSLVVDLIPKRMLATTFGVIAAGSAAGGMMMNWGVGKLVTHSTYDVAFTIMACLHPLALGVLWKLRRGGAPR